MFFKLVNIAVIIFCSSLIRSCELKSYLTHKFDAHYDYEYTDLISEFKTDFLQAQTKFKKSEIEVTGKITEIQYPVCPNPKNPCIIYLGREAHYNGPEPKDCVIIEMAEHLDNSYKGKEITVSTMYDVSYNDDAITIILNKGICKQK